jgi:hypothetical protein
MVLIGCLLLLAEINQYHKLKINQLFVTNSSYKQFKNKNK